MIPHFGISLFEETDYGKIKRIWTSRLAERRDRLIYNLISAVYGVHNDKFSYEIQQDTYETIYGKPNIKEEAQKMIELYKKLEETMQQFKHG